MLAINANCIVVLVSTLSFRQRCRARADALSSPDTAGFHTIREHAVSAPTSDAASSSAEDSPKVGSSNHSAMQARHQAPGPSVRSSSAANGSYRQVNLLHEHSEGILSRLSCKCHVQLPPFVPSNPGHLGRYPIRRLTLLLYLCSGPEKGRVKA